MGHKDIQLGILMLILFALTVIAVLLCRIDNTIREEIRYSKPIEVHNKYDIPMYGGSLYIPETD